MFSKLLLDIQRLYFDNKLFAYITMFSFNLINAFLLNELRRSVYFHFLRTQCIKCLLEMNLVHKVIKHQLQRKKYIINLAISI